MKKEDMNNTIHGEQLALLREAIGKRLIDIEHEKPDGNEVLQRIRFNVEGKWYTLDNKVDWFENYFAQPDSIPHMVFLRREEESEWNMEPERYPIGETITNVLLVNDHVDVLDGGEHYQNWDSTEAVVIETNNRQYGFFKGNTCLDETVLLGKGHDVLSKLEPLKAHWDIFGKPFDAKVTRRLIPLKDGAETEMDRVSIEGDPSTIDGVDLNREFGS